MRPLEPLRALFVTRIQARYEWGEMSSDSESYALGIDEPFSISRSPAIKLYQLKSLKCKGFKSLLYRIKLLYQIGYRLIDRLIDT